MGAVTLLELAMTSANEGKLVLSEIADWFCMESNIAQRLVWATNKELAVQITSMKTLPTVATRKINASFSQTHGTFKQKVEGKCIFGHEINVDVVLVAADPAQRQIQRRASAKAMAFKFNDMFINGNPASDEFKGLSMRADDIDALGGIYSDQKFDAGDTNAGRGCLYDDTSRHYFIDQVGKIIHNTAEHKPDGLLMNAKMYLCFESVMRRLALLKQTEDAFGRIINTFQGVPLIDLGVNADQTTEVITNTESTGGSSGVETSIYSVKYGEGEYLWGIQQAPLDVKDLGEISSSPVFCDRVSWVVGLAVANPKAIVRGYGIVADSGAS